MDGDTLHVALEIAPEVFIENNLRLRGLDCPKLATPEGKVAKRFVDGLVAKGPVNTIHTTGGGICQLGSPRSAASRRLTFLNTVQARD